MAAEPILGAIFLFAGNFNPRGYMLCQGQLLSIAQNAALFSILGTTYGGDGVQTFALPDLRGRAPVGQGNGPGLSPISLGELTGVENVTLVTGNLAAHTHMLMASNQQGSSTDPTGRVIATPVDASFASLSAFNAPPPNAVMAPASIGPTGGNLPFSVRNPMLGLNYIIAVEGVFPSRN